MNNSILRNLLLIVVIALAASCNTSKRINKMNQALEALDNQRITIPPASADQLESDVRFLSSDELMGRETGSEGIEMAANFLKERFQDLEIEPYGDSYYHEFENNGVAGKNVVAMMTGTDKEKSKEVVVIGAHYDHIGLLQAVAGDSIANGANDNATGVASVLAVADIFKNLDFNRRTIVFALFSAEEKGLVGSRQLAKQMKDKGENVVAMINFEMIGTPMQDKDYLVYLTGYDTSNMGEILNKENRDRKVTAKLPAAAKLNLYMRSDNYAFFEEFKIPAQTLSTFDFTNFNEYHKVGDELSGVNTNHMAQVIDAAMPGIFFIVNESGLQMETSTQDE